MRNITEKKVETVLDSINWKIEDARNEVEANRERIQNELSNFQEVTSPAAIAVYATKMNAATEKLRDLYEQRRMMDYLLDEE